MNSVLISLLFLAQLAIYSLAVPVLEEENQPETEPASSPSPTLQKVFDRLSGDDDQISIEELLAAFNKLDPGYDLDWVQNFVNDVQLDKDGNGLITLAEVQALLDREDEIDYIPGMIRFFQFQLADVDADGVLTRTEFTNFIKHFYPQASEEEIQAYFETRDTGISGTLSYNEIHLGTIWKFFDKFERVANSTLQKVFDRLSGDDDQISIEELLAAFKKLNPVYDLDRVQNLVNEVQLDKDGNGLITLAEVQALLVREDETDDIPGMIRFFQFQLADVDADGVLTRTEFTNFIKHFDPEASEEEIQAYFETGDEDNSGDLSYNEFFEEFERAPQREEDEQDVETVSDQEEEEANEESA